MARNDKFTHGGSPLKNLWLLLRALLNVFAFFLLFYSLGTGAKWFYIAGAAALVIVCLFVNLLIPLFKRKK